MELLNEDQNEQEWQMQNNNNNLTFAFKSLNDLKNSYYFDFCFSARSLPQQCDDRCELKFDLFWLWLLILDVRANGWKAETADDVVSHEIRIKLKENETKNPSNNSTLSTYFRLIEIR